MNSKNKRICAGVLVVFCTSLLFARIQEKPQKTELARDNADSFIRMDLLSAEKKPMPPPKRNIFTVGSGSAEAELSPEVLEARMEEIRNSQSTQTQGEEMLSSLNLKYLGYVLSGRKIVGLIVFEGEALAVVEGDLITEGYTVGRISPEEIEVFGPDSEPEMFSIEGEFP
jgi:hypothetical protein